MTKRRQCHGGIHTPEMALYFAVHEYSQGLAAIAVKIGTSADVLRKKVDPKVKSHIPQFAEVIKIMALTRDERLLDAINSTVGACWFYPESVADAPADLDVLKTSTGLMARSVDVITELETALESGDIDSDERARIDKAMLKLHQQIKAIDTTAERFESNK
jgi:hypothetical protein